MSDVDGIAAERLQSFIERIERLEDEKKALQTDIKEIYAEANRITSYNVCYTKLLRFVKGDICDRALIDNLMQEHDVRGVVHFAAESHVDNSITGPEAFVKTNVMGVITSYSIHYTKLYDILRAFCAKQVLSLQKQLVSYNFNKK